MEIHGKFMEIYGNQWKSMEIHRKSMEIHEIFGNPWKSIDIHGKIIEIHGNRWKFIRNLWKSTENP